MVSVKQRLTEKCFNTQPPKGGWVQSDFVIVRIDVFQHTAA